MHHVTSGGVVFRLLGQAKNRHSKNRHAHNEPSHRLPIQFEGNIPARPSNRLQHFLSGLALLASTLASGCVTSNRPNTLAPDDTKPPEIIDHVDWTPANVKVFASSTRSEKSYGGDNGGLYTNRLLEQLKNASGFEEAHHRLSSIGGWDRTQHPTETPKTLSGWLKKQHPPRFALLLAQDGDKSFVADLNHMEAALKQTYGVPQSHIMRFDSADFIQTMAGMNWLSKQLSYPGNEKAEVLIYYSGHTIRIKDGPVLNLLGIGVTEADLKGMMETFLAKSPCVYNIMDVCNAGMYVKTNPFVDSPPETAVAGFKATQK
ncbi:MAG: hypothetical protein K2X01_05790 [Cyanobacteria bacterium]|nr:hypothetical protein [Cyanobacteriota bacterium]